MRLEHKVAVVTGGAQGIGQAVVRDIFDTTWSTPLREPCPF